MAPTDVAKASPKEQRSVIKTAAAKSRSYSPGTAKRKTISSAKKRNEKIPLRSKMSITLVDTRKRTSTVPIMNTPKPKENKSAPVPPGSVKKSAQKRRPVPAHSGVPVPEKMKALMRKYIQN